MAKKDTNKLITYNEYLNSLNKNELINILNTFHIECKKNCKKNVYVDLVEANISNIVKSTLDLFQIDEFHNIKLFLKKKGKVTIRVNHLLLDFMNNLQKHHLVKKEGKTFYLFKEVLEEFKKKINSKNINTKIKENTIEYKFILGCINVYGVVEYSKFYDLYHSKYELSDELALVRIKDLANFYGDFKVWEDNKNKKIYLASTVICSLKECKSIVNKKLEYEPFTVEDFIALYDFTYMIKYKSYKKLMKFINRNYYIEKGSQKIVNKYVLIPFLTNYQLNKNKAKDVLSKLIDMYFEFNNQKHKNKFISLVENLALDYPSWELKGHSEREKK